MTAKEPTATLVGAFEGEKKVRLLKYRSVFTAFVSLSVLAACATTPRPITNSDPTVDFTRYETFGFIDNPATNRGSYESLATSFLKAAIAQEMDKRGLSYAEDPDLIVNFYVHTKEKIRSRNVPSSSVYYGWRDPFYDTWGGYGGYETRIDQYTEGTLNIDVVDARRNTLVWEGSVAGRITEEVIANLEKSIDRGVRIILSEFPVAPGG